MKSKPIYELAHIGINLGSESEAQKTASQLADLFGLEIKSGSKSYFAGAMFECIRIPFRGTNGHIGLRVSNMEQALADLKAKGVQLDIDGTAEYNARGELVNVYLHDEIGGFAVHLMKQ
ncbi:2-dehydro-3-deoxyphosphogluconate aldolase [Oscillibacter sp. MSJ-2]|uniref:2-dehydro-3-deoxyphosphogluconate aldolase n=1 Tax=Dysosmobacter acutus TaxID=2841504 RepID=A0ABS6F5G5_9FIRM|nr:2-dehydro-3-deoxyphosphogluconate aldolase [Dysosmobacter acutus]MBU5625532.1 2-dehydro-3-deoxyphosphogluconate aldolase [Dysosmobacter acutus]